MTQRLLLCALCGCAALLWACGDTDDASDTGAAPNNAANNDAPVNNDDDPVNNDDDPVNNDDPGNNDPGNNDVNNDLPMTSDVAFEIGYGGQAQGNLSVALFEAFPPAGPPNAFEQVDDAAFPLDVVIADVPAATYTALVVLDVAPFNPAAPGPEDLTATVELEVPQNGGPAQVTLEDGDDPQDPQPADVLVEISFDGPQRGPIVVSAFERLPADGPAAVQTTVEPTDFPAQATLAQVPGGTHQFQAFMDLPPSSPNGPGQEDPVAESPAIAIDGQTINVELTLVLEDDPVDPPDGDVYVGTQPPYGPGALGVEIVTLSAGQAGAPVPMEIHVPTGQEGPFAVLVFQHGFVLNAGLYTSLFELLTSHGFVIVAPTMYDTGGLPFGTPSTAEEVALAVELRQWLEGGTLAQQAGVAVDLDRLGYVGHSRGGKVSWTLLLEDPSLAAAIAGVDPVDGTGGPPGQDGGEPRVTEGDFSVLGQTPSLIIGTGLGSQGGAFACAPEGDNHVQFNEAALAPAWYMVVPDHGHMDMLDDDCGLACFACTSSNDRATMRATVAGALVSFFRASLQGDQSAYAVLEDAQAAPATVTVESR